MEHMTMEHLIAWLDGELKNRRDLVDKIEQNKVQFWTQEPGKPMYHTTEKTLIETKTSLVAIEDQLKRLRSK